MPHDLDSLDERLRKVEASVNKMEVMLGSVNDKLNVAIAYEKRISSLENFKSKVLGYAAGIVGLGGLVLFLIDKFTKF